MKNTILAFYDQDIPDSKGRFLWDILTSSDEWLEKTHDYIQFLFPNREPSHINPDAPLLTNELIEECLAYPGFKAALKSSLNRMIFFYRMDDLHPWWVTKNNHNYLRITRIIHTLKDFKMHDEIDMFFEKLIKIYKNNQDILNATRAFEYWENAYYGN